MAGDDLSILSTLLAVAEERSFTRAASQLNLTQSAISRQIAKLERHLGVALFARHGPRLELTDRGQAYAAAVEPALAACTGAPAT